MNQNNKIKIIAFDADDTLWDCQGHFERVMQQLYTLLLPWTGSRERAAEELFATERKNMPLMGYGAKAFSLSMIETAMRVSQCQLPMAQLQEVQQWCYGLLQLPATPLPGVKSTLQALSEQGWTMVAFTKGELLDQQLKLQRSGLLPFFSHVEITSDKGQPEFLELCRKLDIHPSELLMVGNSLKSDIAPALAIGARAVYIPFHVTWELERHDGFEHPHMVQIDHFSELLAITSHI